MFLRFANILLILVSLASARVITWTAYSEVSQTAADEEAIAGVARQISAKVDASTTVSRSEKVSGDSTTSNKSIQVKNSVRSDIFLKGIRLQKLPKNGKKFGTSATLDLDELTSNYRFNLETIQKEVSDIEVQAQNAINAKLYGEAERLLNEIPLKTTKYQAILDEMSVYVPLDNSMRIKTNDIAIRNHLTSELQGLKIQAVDESSLSVKVVKNGIAIPHFPLLAEHNGKSVASATTDSNGIANFTITAKELQKLPHELSIIPKLSLNLRNAASIQAITLHYSMNIPECKLNMTCSSTPNTCTAILSKLSDSFGQVIQSSQGTPAIAKIQATPIRALKNLTSYNVTLTLEHGDSHCQWAGSGTGRTEEEAAAAAVKKMDLGGCLATLKLCP